MKKLLIIIAMLTLQSVVFAQEAHERIIYEVKIPANSGDMDIRFNGQSNSGIISVAELVAADHIVIIQGENHEDSLAVLGYTMITESTDGQREFAKMNSGQIASMSRTMVDRLKAGSKIILTEIAYRNEAGEAQTIAEGSGAIITVIN